MDQQALRGAFRIFDDPLDAIGLDCETVIPNSLMREVVATGKPILLDVLETDREPLVVTRLPLKDDAGVTIGAIGFALFDEMKALTPLFAHYSRVQQELIATRQSLAQARRAKYTFSSFVGTSPVSLEVKRQARRAALVDSPVLLLGETGTGKELLAHSIHGASTRAGKPLVTVNVAAIPDTLLEVEFFGAAAGAYTGAERKGRVGKFELADGGTLFLDEIGDMPLPLQGKLLRVLQDKEFEPLGSNRIVRADVRIIAATSADLSALVAAGRFRADLFYRLNVLTIQAPPLRDRLGDIEALAYAILEDLSADTRPGHGGHFVLHKDGLQLLEAYSWPGNVRELRNTLERALMLSETRAYRCPRAERVHRCGAGRDRGAGGAVGAGSRRSAEPLICGRHDRFRTAFSLRCVARERRARRGCGGENRHRAGDVIQEDRGAGHRRLTDFCEHARSTRKLRVAYSRNRK